MKTKTIKYSILILVILLINNIALGIVWMEKKEAILFHYYVWRNRHASDIASIEQYQSKVDSIAPYIFPLLVQTYMDVNASHSDRHIVALALIKVDKEKAEALNTKKIEISKKYFGLAPNRSAMCLVPLESSGSLDSPHTSNQRFFFMWCGGGPISSLWQNGFSEQKVCFMLRDQSIVKFTFHFLSID